MSCRLLRRIMDMYKDDAVASNIHVLSEELSQRLFDADGEFECECGLPRVLVVLTVV